MHSRCSGRTRRTAAAGQRCCCASAPATQRDMLIHIQSLRHDVNFTLAQAALAALGRQALHAAVLGFEHPATGETMRIEAPMDEELRHCLQVLRQQATK